jgi:hypothetical protein
VLVVTFLVVSCTVDPYETGDTSLSYLKAEMVDMHVVGREVRSIVTDADERLSVSSSFLLPEKIEHRDTTYRVMLYYNKVGNKPIELKSMRQAYVVRPSDRQSSLTLKDDPVKLISAWKAQNGNYLNLSLGFMTGNVDDDGAVHKLGLVVDAVETMGDGSRTYYLIFHHDQDSIPEYYTQTVYLSIPLKDYAIGDRICIKMNTYSGCIEKSFVK